MNTLFYDTETQGIPLWKEPSDSEGQPHIVQVAGLLVDEQRTVIGDVNLIVKPDGWVIPEEVAEIHGITTERAMDEGVPEKEALECLIDLWQRCGLRVGHDQSFDARIIRIALKRHMNADQELSDRWRDAPKACTGLLSKPICCLPQRNRYGWKMPKLSEAYEHFMGKPLEGGHEAMTDARACMEIYFAIQDKKEATAA